MKPSTSFKKLFLACAVTAAATLSMSAHALQQDFTSIPTNNSDGNPVGATASFTPGAGTIQLTLTNTVVNLHDLAQTLSDISFDVTGGSAVTTEFVSPPNTALIGLADGGVITRTTGTGGPWSLSATGGGFHFTALNGQGPGAGDQTHSLILGDVTDPNYCKPTCTDGLANTTFNPFIDTTATFTLGITGVTSDSTISNVVFSFGTGPETFVGVPIPAAVWLFGSGLVGLIGIARRKMAVTSSATPALA